MIPAYIHVFILRPGHEMDSSKRPAGEPSPHAPDIIMQHGREHDGFARVENDARVIYSVERGKRLEDDHKPNGKTALEQIEIDLFGRLAETLLCIESVTELPDAALLDVTRSDPFWLHSTLAECNWDFLSEGDFQEIHEHAAKLIAHEAAEIEREFLRGLSNGEGCPNHVKLKQDIAAQTEIAVSWPCFFGTEMDGGSLEEPSELCATPYLGAATLVQDDVAAQLAAGDLAHKAVFHVLDAIRGDARKAWLMGHGTGSRAKLLEAWRAKHGKTEEEAEAFWTFHDPKKFERHVAELELSELLMTAFREGKLAMKEHEAEGYGFTAEQVIAFRKAAKNFF